MDGRFGMFATELGMEVTFIEKASRVVYFMQ